MPIRVFLLLRYAFALLLASGPLLAPAQTPSTVFLEELTWTELTEQIKEGKTTIILPIGGTEQNGPHMVLGKHNVRVKALSEHIAVALGDALVAPVVAYVPEGNITPRTTSHMRFTGTITTPDVVFERLIEYAARSFKVHGFHDVVILGDHGGYQAAIKAVAERLNKEWDHTRVRVHAIPEYYKATEDDYAQALRKRGFSADEIGTHAGLADTSLSLAIDPKLVRTERMRSNPPPGAADGVTGDPRKSSAELGKLGVDVIVKKSVDAIKKAVDR